MIESLLYQIIKPVAVVLAILVVSEALHHAVRGER